MNRIKKLLATIVKLPTWVYLTAVSLVALNLRLIGLLRSDIWHDEGYTAMIVGLTPQEIISVAVNDVHPPLYYLLLHWWQVIFGSSTVGLRSFSIACGVALVVLSYFLLKKLFDEKIARFGTLLVAIGPFLIRYSQEARMYSLSALIAVAATLVFVNALSSKKAWGWWIGYGILIAAGIYTQYFLALIIPVHLVYAWLLSGPGLSGLMVLIKKPGLWLAAGVGSLLFLPWLPTMISQVTRVSSGFWIPPVNALSIPNTISSFILYNHDLTRWLGVTLVLTIIIITIWLAHKLPKYRATIWLLLSWSFLPMIIIALLSLRNPVFYDRYFTYSAPAFYSLLAVLVILMPIKLLKKPSRKLALGAVVSVLLIIGAINIYTSPGHQMSQIAAAVGRNFKTGDQIISAELYTFFDFSHYNSTDSSVHLLEPKPFGKYGEWSLIRAVNTPQIAKLSDSTADRVWIIGKTGEHSYFSTDTPQGWKLISEYSAGDSVARVYEVVGEQVETTSI